MAGQELSLLTTGSFLLTIEILCLSLFLLTVGDLSCNSSLLLTSEVFLLKVGVCGRVCLST